MTRWMTLVLLVAPLAGCGDDGGRGDRPGSDGAMSCSSDSDCDDTFDCTIDTCGVGGSCRYDAIDERCADGLVCEPGRGCVSEASCASDDDCDDDLSCTIDRCGVGGECSHTGVDERCEGPGATCDPENGEAPTGCTESTGCTTDADCDDEIDCTVDSCTVAETCDHTPVDERCDDGEVCSPTSGCFETTPCEMDSDCDDGNFCNGVETCVPEFGCQPPEMVRMCDDTDDCTVDSCDSGRDMCVFACDTSRPECDCPVFDVPCSGIFDVVPAPAQTCAALIGPAQVDYNVSEVEFTCVGPVLSIDARNVPNPSINSPLTQSMRATDGTFTAVAEVEGDCLERYTLDGMFTGPDTFEATWTAEYIGSTCFVADCDPQNIMVTGTRR